MTRLIDVMVGQPIKPVQCTLSVRVATSAESFELDPDAWSVTSAELVEEIDRPFALTVEVRTEDQTLDFGLFRGARAIFEFGRGDDLRPVLGVVIEAEYVTTAEDHLRYRLRIGPTAALADRIVRSRIFQDRNAVEIAGEVFQPLLARFGGSIDASRLRNRLTKRDYCVQWEESDLQFVRRILAADGISFVFTHSGDAEALVLLDSNDAFRAVGEGDREPTPIPVVTVEPELADRESVTFLSHVRGPQVQRIIDEDWDWLSPTPEVRTSSTEPARVEPWHLTQRARFAARRLVEDGGTLVDDTPERAERGRKRAVVRAEFMDGEGLVTMFSAGRTFELHGHPLVDLDRAYLLTRVRHEFQTDQEHGRGWVYDNEFLCQPLENDYCAALMPRPTVRGPVTALVTGPRGEEVHVDALGRVQVTFPWNTHEPDQASCWLRVAQSWAGSGFGAMVIPRIGTEVVVSFLYGDPDQPIVTGCVYNGANQPPYALPEHKTKTTFRTSSSPGGDGHNELTFEDADDHEEIYMHAQRNLRERVRSCHSTSVGIDESLRVGRNRSKTVGGEEMTQIEKDRYLRVHGSECVIIVGSQAVQVGCEAGKGSMASEIDEGVSALRVLGRRYVWGRDEHFIEVGSKAESTTKLLMTETTALVEAHESITFRVGNSTITMMPDAIAIDAPLIELGGVGRGYVCIDKNVYASGAENVKLRQGAGCLELASDNATLSAVELKASGTTTTVQGTGTAKLTAPSTEIEGTQALSMSGNVASLEGKSVTSISGGVTTNVTAKGDVVVKAGFIRLN